MKTPKRVAEWIELTQYALGRNVKYFLNQLCGFVTLLFMVAVLFGTVEFTTPILVIGSIVVLIFAVMSSLVNTGMYGLLEETMGMLSEEMDKKND